jgi:hypothetical protein
MLLLVYQGLLCERARSAKPNLGGMPVKVVKHAGDEAMWVFRH